MQGHLPNVLFIQLDQLAPHALRYHGNKVSKTPNIDKLMQEGVVFSNAYCNSPICSPSRFSMMSGQLPTKIQAWDNAAEFSANIPTFAHVMRMQGYHTVLAGKMHFVGADQLHGFEERLTTDVYPADFGWTPNWDEEATGVRNPLFFETLVSVAEANWVHSSMQLDFDEEVAFKVRRKLREMGRRRTARLHRGDSEGTDRPFFIVASFTEPHDPYSGPKDFWDMYTDEEIDMPSVPFIPRDERDFHSARVYDCMDNGDFDITEERIRNSRHAYYAMMSYVDSKIGELLSTLEQEGLAQDTLVVLTSDHGDMQGERGMWFKETFFERACRVPLVFHAEPRLAMKLGLGVPREVSYNVSLVDLMPTFTDLTCKPGQTWKDIIPGRIDGRSLKAVLQNAETDSDPTKEDLIYVEYTSEMIPGGWYMVKKGYLKFIYSTSEPLLFDLKADPKEMNNVVDQAEYKESVAELLALAKAQWPDLTQLNEIILQSQRSRRMIHQAMMSGKTTAWDFQPFEDTRNLYIRNNGQALQDLEYICRAPYRGARPTK
eukprot:CAMPEP_0206447006 /NCGR_PEP_ID=MMETSP0324_2-20121206/16504_1 /ASSEMBLY_ACC=CAM_ASM_000836 /TAXON_ID=2866 /ORGANISM="Crypthecodinium cohnii, Strain Seligo" /LENGTH=543 /DNA_ID=CAMNT_0053915645 /DNA_START=67 /DNA_END=1698 /DNA_ORIENTATION=+